ncbi:MAG: hypothetical protein AAF989_14300 [Planctomycetota bacterium]
MSSWGTLSAELGGQCSPPGCQRRESPASWTEGESIRIGESADRGKAIPEIANPTAANVVRESDAMVRSAAFAIWHPIAVTGGEEVGDSS